MKNLLKKLHIVPNQAEGSERSTSLKGNRSNDDSSGRSSLTRSSPSHHPEQKPFANITGWLNSVTNRKSSSHPSSSNVGAIEETRDPSNSEAVSDTLRWNSESSNTRDPGMEEDYQIQLAMELSASEDPEAVQIEAVKQISLSSCPPQNTPAEVVAYRYWNYNALNYDDKILDGFYDLYGIVSGSTSEKMPSLVDLQGAPVSDGISWEAVLVNRATDSDLLKLEQKALMMALESRSGSLDPAGTDMVQKLGALVANYMGGPVGDPENMLKAWTNLSNCLRETVRSMVLPLGSLTLGLARHRALLFKVLADCVGIPCRLLKGQQYMGSDNVAMNIVKVGDGREYIVDLMADPGTLIPSDAVGPHIEYDEPFYGVRPFLRDVDLSAVESSSSGVYSGFEPFNERSRSGGLAGREKNYTVEDYPDELIGIENPRVGSSQEPPPEPMKGEVVSKLYSNDSEDSSKVDKVMAPGRPTHPFTRARSPSWTEGVSSPAVRRMKVKDVSQYMIDAAKENPQLAQKLHDVLLESGVVAPPSLFTEIYNELEDASIVEVKKQTEDKDEKKKRGNGTPQENHAGAGQFLPPVPYHGVQSKPSISGVQVKRIEGLDVNHPLNLGEVSELPYSSGSEVPAALALETSGAKFVPVAAAAAAVVASSMVVAAAMSSNDSNTVLPASAVATATAAVVVATTAAVSKQYEQSESCVPLPGGASCFNQLGSVQHDGDAEDAEYAPRGSGDQEHDACVAHAEAERNSDRSAGNDSSKSDIALDDVAEWEIPWEEITLGDRIGLGSYGEVYRGEWHGTIRIIKKLRHPNVVLFMGAVTRAPNLSIVTEFLPRGSLYRLIHRPNNQLDERRRLRMALDVARGMNYLHNCTPVIVHRDLKSPNLLVDKNWVVKVCDFGLSRMKHNTFLSSRSTAGTVSCLTDSIYFPLLIQAEWMAPEVLRNEPSDEKCDVFSFGVILWELSTLQQPWGGLNPMQVVGAVGFQHRRLDIPEDMDPVVADIVRKCWQTDPKMRPSFAEIMAALKPLQKRITNSQVPRHRAPLSSGQVKGETSLGTEEKEG
ncbi:probable serine/threonine-protein kinase SIS8 isoform X3 [Macadamia integrifolia]|uniref:probable serine/threonine-protein kinase SIS8 isoform X3 n=1 Tax=Macadamia integrifolia TaxID=60698 RepID=UPI001C4F599F|nr:probable serine/threonine-protein kinase SIS8 isoform X3 [Macadamia integrifolia]